MRWNPSGKTCSKTVNEFLGGQGHRFDLSALTIMFPPKPDLIVFHIEQTVVGNCDTVCIAAHVIEDLLRPSEGTLGVSSGIGFCRQRCSLQGPSVALRSPVPAHKLI
jgi:hypothetical protein